MEQVKVREANGEVLVFLDRHMGDRLHALQEASKIIQREIIREQSGLGSSPDRPTHNHEL